MPVILVEGLEPIIDVLTSDELRDVADRLDAKAAMLEAEALATVERAMTKTVSAIATVREQKLRAGSAEWATGGRKTLPEASVGDHLLFNAIVEGESDDHLEAKRLWDKAAEYRNDSAWIRDGCP